jgi:Pvc16 N-terminal domain
LIQLVFRFLADELNKFILLRNGAATPSNLVLPANISKADDLTAVTSKIIMSLVNVEEDRVSKIPMNSFPVAGGTGVEYKNPPVYVNLYVLFSVNRNYDEDALLYLSYIMQFFQHRNVFNLQNSPAMSSMSPLIEQLSAELVTMNFEQVNHLWASLGGKYLPSALYKIKQVVIDDRFVLAGGGIILEIENTLLDKTVQAL